MSATEYRPREGSKAELGFNALADGPMTLAALALVMDVPPAQVIATLNVARKHGAVVSVVDEHGTLKQARVDRPLGNHRKRDAGAVGKVSEEEAWEARKHAAAQPVKSSSAPAKTPTRAPRQASPQRAVAAPAAPAAVAPAAAPAVPALTASTGICFGAYSDGDLLIARGDESFHLAAEETRALLAYLATQRELLQRIFGGGV